MFGTLRCQCTVRTFFKSSPEDMFLDFGERGREKGRWGGAAERERAKHQFLLVCTWAREQNHHVRMCPERGLNLQTF